MQTDFTTESERLDFWATAARQLTWETPFDTTLDYTTPPFAKWFPDGSLNVAVNCVDRHVAAGNGDKVAIHWIGETGDTRDITYADLLTEVSRAANALTDLGISHGDRVAIYLPMLPEAIVAMLACARLGVIHSVVFAGFSATALRSRVDDAAAKLIITSDGQYRRGEPAPLKANVDTALAAPGHTVEHVLVVRRTGSDIDWVDGRDVWWHDVVPTAAATHTPTAYPATTPLFLLYTSGTTGKPKGIVHSSGGYLTQANFTFRTVFAHQPDDVFWCAADIGWVTGHTYLVYGPLSNGATEIIYEGSPNTPNEHRHFEIIEKYGVTIYYAAPTLIRTFMKWGRSIPLEHDLSSLRLLGSVGEPINPEAWRWYHEVIGGGRCPIVDTWWQTETGAQMITPLPSTTPLKPGAAMRPVPGISVKIVDEQGHDIPDGEAGFLVIDKPWPSMLLTLWGDDERFVDTYWSKYADQGWYFAGDGARYDTDHDLWLLGRIDDVMNVSGHRISTAEVESALVGHGDVAEAAVTSAPDPTTGEAIVAFVILKSSAQPQSPDELVDKLKAHVAQDISPIAKPREIHVVPELPKTRSGKIMRRLLRDVAAGRELGDTSTLVDPSVFEAIRASH